MRSPRGYPARLIMVYGIVLSTLAGCGPTLGPLPGTIMPNAALPTIAVAPGHRQVTFTWELDQNSLVARGNGVARISPPDSARVDLFLAGGFGGGAAAILIGDSLIVPPGGGMGVMNLIPPAPLLWAALGRLSIPSLPDTVIRARGDTVGADVGHPAQWRLFAIHNTLSRLDHVSGNRIVESVERTADGGVRYQSSDHRSLVLHIQRDLPAQLFDASIWHF